MKNQGPFFRSLIYTKTSDTAGYGSFGDYNGEKANPRTGSYSHHFENNRSGYTGDRRQDRSYGGSSSRDSHSRDSRGSSYGSSDRGYDRGGSRNYGGSDRRDDRGYYGSGGSSYGGGYSRRWYDMIIESHYEIKLVSQLKKFRFR